ncbi:hypothetical protein [Paraflavitalea sp. CAU 1676]|uniref:hypothetical protein n=1 Tax=Paraflavitalea sp. CAU 1676 TaxID=3032598 RepID=UPI0023DA9CBA|nr:hypothetical protein [Paraflavitalea sp. CAU 1676]MDF2189774.1 hypothetical protein [Paraflavitalea sp. CAU 1676]
MRKKSLETILVLVLACIVCHLIFKQRYWLIVGLCLGLVGVLAPWAAEMIHWAWNKLALALGFVSGRLILIMVFYVFLFPISLLSRLFRKNEAVRLKKNAGTYYTERNIVYTKESMEHPW